MQQARGYGSVAESWLSVCEDLGPRTKPRQSNSTSNKNPSDFFVITEVQASLLAVGMEDRHAGSVGGELWQGQESLPPPPIQREESQSPKHAKAERLAREVGFFETSHGQEHGSAGLWSLAAGPGCGVAESLA